MGSEWQQFCLADAGSIVTGKTPRGGIPEFEGSDVPFVTPPDFNGSMWIERANRSISELGAQSVKGSIIPRCSVLVTCIGSDMGKAALTASRCVTNQQINAVLVDETKFCPEFIYYNLSLRKDEIRGLAGGSAQPILNKSAFSQIRFWAPPLSEQRTIATALRPINDRIALLRETNATLEAIAQALFKSWFVDFEPVHARARGEQPAGLAPEVAALFPDSFEEFELGMVPQGWAVGTLSEICSISSGKRPPERSDELSDECHIPLYGGAGLMGYTSASLFETPRIVTGRVGTLGKVHVAYPPFWASDNVLVLTPAEDSIFAFCLHWVSAIDVHALNRGSSQPLLTQKDLGAQLGVIPLPEVLVQFEATVSPLYKQIRANLEQAQTLANLRDTLLPRLISGQLRLPDAEAMVSEAQA
ncbi:MULTISPECIES: restriction endonuclease subunit S [unclassified Aeromonas]|nr:MULTISPECIES: restriction endonuclease subunit S [unclassified Aeromonas]MBL0443320.1 restriction endonuclease subunit S [Aeromonas veronii]